MSPLQPAEMYGRQQVSADAADADAHNDGDDDGTDDGDSGGGSSRSARLIPGDGAALVTRSEGTHHWQTYLLMSFLTC